MISPTRTVSFTEKIRVQMNRDLVETVQSKKQLQIGDLSERSQLELTVNDSQSGKSFAQVYQQEEVIGRGGFALVYRSKHKGNGSYYAVKEAIHSEYEESGSNSLREEVATLKLLRENLCVIIRLHDVFTESNPDRTYLVMEHMRGGDLLDRINQKGHYNERKGRIVARTLLEALAFCHKKRIAHRDIKPENVLLADKDDDTTIKLCDFGCAKTVTAPYSLKTMAGSPDYAAPEVYEHSTTGGYDELCDIWSAGVVIYVLLAGAQPFEGSVKEVACLICNGDWEFTERYWKDVSQKPKDLIRSLLVVDPNNRYTADQALASKWLQRRELNRSLSDKDILGKKKKSKARKNLVDKFSQSERDWDIALDDSFILSPVPMEWIPESPAVRRIRREHPEALRRFSKPKLGDCLASISISEDSVSNLSLEGGIVEEILSGQSKNHQSFRMHCSIPDLDNDDHDAS